MPVDQFDYSDPAIAFRALKSLVQNPYSRALALDALWLETRERALFVYPRVVAAMNAELALDRLDALEQAVKKAPGFISTEATPDLDVEAALLNLLEAIGIDRAQQEAESLTEPKKATHDASDAWEGHVIRSDFMQSRFAGTGVGGGVLTPLEDGIRRLTTVLIGTNHLSRETNEGRLPFPGKVFGLPELNAIRIYVDQCVGSAGE